MKISVVTDYLESLFPLQYQEDYDNSGLIIGDANKKVTDSLVALDCTEEVIEEAITLNCNLIITHHPLLFTSIKSITGKNYIERIILKAIKNDIAIYCIHTNLDNVKYGVNSVIADRIGVINQEILRPSNKYIIKLVFYCPISDSNNLKNKLWEAGAGKIGNYSHCSFSSVGNGTFQAGSSSSPKVGEKNKLHIEKEEKIEMVFYSNLKSKILNVLIDEHPYEEVAYELYQIDNLNKDIGAGLCGDLKETISANEFLIKLKKIMQTDCIRYTNLKNKFISKVALCGGSGSFLLEDAKRVNADIFISSDFKYHQFFEADNDIIIADIGHYESEQFTKELIYNLLNKKFTKFATQLSKINTNPIKYL